MKTIIRAAAAVTALTMALSAFAGCTKTDGSGEKEKKKTDAAGTRSAVSEKIKTYGASVTPADIKEAFGIDDSSEVMPLYNVAQDESFTFDFKFDFYENDIDQYDYVTVHTDSACEEESRIYYYADFETNEGATALTISPMSPILETDSQQDASIYDGVNTWGNAPIYYMAIHYDMEAETPVKLDEPVIVPFTVISEIPAPNVKGVVDETGRLKLTWDPVEGAEKYIIYKLRDGDLWTGEDNHALNGPETGFESLSMVRESETAETEFDNFDGDNHGLGELTNNSGTYIIGQNYCVCGDYYVSAVVNGEESGFSAGVSTADLILPYKVVEENDILYNRYNDVSQFPSTIDVCNIDGSISTRNVEYTRKDDGVDLFGFPRVEYWYTIEGTAITGYVVLVDYECEVPDDIGEDSTVGNAPPEDNVTKRPDNDVETIIPVDPDSPKQETDDGLVEQQQQNTQEHIEQGNRSEVANAPEGVYINADTAEEEWLALNLISVNSDISLEAFPSLQDPYTLVDTFYKVYYQNPYIMGITSFEYDYNNFVFHVDYTYDENTAASKQSEISSKADEVVSSVISDGMSDQDKVLAIYDYLTENSVYDDDALASAEANNFRKVEGWEFEDSFNTYGVLVNGKGVCMSYAYAFRLLCDLSGVESIVTTGFLDGNLPHAWNMVKLDGEWYEIDCTNNAVTTGIPYFLYNADSSLAEQSGYTKDDLFAIDDKLGEYVGNDDSKEYYSANGLAPESMDGLKQAITDNVTADTKVFAVRWSGEFDNEKFADTVRLAFNELGLEDKLDSTKFVNQYGFIVLVIE